MCYIGNTYVIYVYVNKLYVILHVSRCIGKIDSLKWSWWCFQGLVFWAQVLEPGFLGVGLGLLSGWWLILKLHFAMSAAWHWMCTGSEWFALSPDQGGWSHRWGLVKAPERASEGAVRPRLCRRVGLAGSTVSAAWEGCRFHCVGNIGLMNS